jgi:hypothetical protein
VQADGDEEADWYIIHLPTGHSVRKYPYTDASTKTLAAAIAKCFYKECVARGIDLKSIDPGVIPKSINGLPPKERESFWNTIGAVRDVSETTTANSGETK